MSGSSSEEILRTMNGGGASSSSFCYSTTSGSSNSSSVENISTSSSIENGDQLTITFIPRKPSRGVVRSSVLQDEFSLDDIFLQEDEDYRVSPPVPVQKLKSFCGRTSISPTLSLPSSSTPSWYDGVQSVSTLLKTVTNDEDERTSSGASSYSHIIQHLAGDGILLKSLEKGAAFPYLHLSTSGFCVPPSRLMHENGEVKQGVYKEIKRVVPPDSWIKLDSHQDQDQCKSTWLFLGYKTLDKNNETLEQTWKEWTGVRHLYLELRTDIHIRRISFFRRRDPLDCLDTFTYVAFIEIGTISGKTHRWLLDFVQRTRLERMHSTMIVYEEIELWEADSGIP